MEETGADLAVPGETQVALTYELEALATGAPSRGVLRGPWSGDLALGITDPLALDLELVNLGRRYLGPIAAPRICS